MFKLLFLQIPNLRTKIQWDEIGHSSNLNEGIRVVLFLLRKDYTHKKRKNAHKQTKPKKAVLNALKKHLRGRKLLIRLFASLCSYALFVVFVLFNQ